MYEDIIYQAYRRAQGLGYARTLATTEYDKLFVVGVRDVSRTDNEALARSAKDFTQALNQLGATLGGKNETFKRMAIREAMRFAGTPMTEEEIEQIVRDGPVFEPAAGELPEGENQA